MPKTSRIRVRVLPVPGELPYGEGKRHSLVNVHTGADLLELLREGRAELKRVERVGDDEQLLDLELVETEES